MTRPRSLSSESFLISAASRAAPSSSVRRRPSMEEAFSSKQQHQLQQLQLHERRGVQPRQPTSAKSSPCLLQEVNKSQLNSLANGQTRVRRSSGGSTGSSGSSGSSGSRSSGSGSGSGQVSIPSTSAAGRVTIPSTRRHASSRRRHHTYDNSDHNREDHRFSPTSSTAAEPVQMHEAMSQRVQHILKKKRSFGQSEELTVILRKASGLLESATQHTQLTQQMASSGSGGITPPSVKRLPRPLTPSRKWDEIRPDAEMRHRYVCLSSRARFLQREIDQEEFDDIVRRSGEQLRIREPFGAEYFVDTCMVSGSPRVVAGRGQLRRIPKHRNLLLAASREPVHEALADTMTDYYTSSEDEDGYTSDESTESMTI